MATIGSGTAAREPTAAEAAFVGMYVQRDVDSQAQLFILPDNTFCFTFMGGSLDLIKAGRWKPARNGGAIHLQEERADAPIHPAFAQTLDRLEEGMVGINFDGYTLSNACSPAIALSKTDTTPTNLRPLFSAESSSWSQTYALPLVEAREARYIFIADREVDTYGRPQQRMRVTQYRLENHDAVRLGYNKLQAEPPISAIAELHNNTIFLDGDKFGSRQSLDPDIIKEVREQCVNPVLHPNDDTHARRPSDDVLYDGEILTPLRTFYLEASSIKGEPIFADRNESNTTATDSMDDLIEAENRQLQSALQSALKDNEKLGEFVLLAQKLSKKKNRVRKHLPEIATHFATLLVKVTADRNFEVSATIFLTFMKTIYPSTVGVNNETMSYSLSVIASQGLIITTPLKNSEIGKIVFDELLGKNFDITRHKNSTLIYNLACYYAVGNQKRDMLIAIRQARKRGKPAEQFTADTDFKSYWDDADFLNALDDE